MAAASAVLPGGKVQVLGFCDVNFALGNTFQSIESIHMCFLHIDLFL